MFFDEQTSWRFQGVARKVGDIVTTGIAWKGRKKIGLHRLREWKFLFDSMYWKVLLLGMEGRIRTQALSISSPPFDHWTNALQTLGIFSALGIFSCVKSPIPGTTIILSPGAWAISSLESRSARSCLLEGTARKSFPFWGSGTVLSSTIFLL